MRRVLIALLGAMMLSGILAPTPAQAHPSRPAIAGSFIQPYLPDSWTDAQLASEFNYLRADGLTEQVLQWSAETDNPDSVGTYYPTSLPGFHQESKTDVVGRTLTAADAAGVREYLGLQLNEKWWTFYASDASWLDREADFAIRLADDLLARYGTHRSLAGWYLAFEPDNENFLDAASWQRMSDFYAKVAGHLHHMSPRLPVVVAPFYDANGGQTPAQWRTMWASILKKAQLDAIALQDGVGAGHASVEQLPAWFAATKAAIKDAGVNTQLWSDTETFYPDFTPMAVAGYVADMKAVAPFVTKFWSFAWDHYVSPLSVAASYERTYANYLRSGRVETVPPAKLRSLKARVDGPQSVTLTWSGASDNVGVAGVYVLRDGVRVGKIPTLASCTGMRPCVRPVPPTSFTLNGLEPENTYAFAVQAFDGAGNVSHVSSAVRVTLPSAPVTHTSVSAGKTYVASTVAGDDYPDAGGELTDGVLAPADYSDAGWQGRLAAEPFSFTVDLGSVQMINEVDSRWLQDPGTGIVLPKDVLVAVSDDAVSWTSLGTMYPPSLGDTRDVGAFRLLGVSGAGRFVRVTVEPAGSGWSFTDELDVRQT